MLIPPMLGSGHHFFLLELKVASVEVPGVRVSFELGSGKGGRKAGEEGGERKRVCMEGKMTRGERGRGCRGEEQGNEKDAPEELYET
jgi:hypothetical protein